MSGSMTSKQAVWDLSARSDLHCTGDAEHQCVVADRHIVLGGAGATGQTDYTIQPAFLNLVPQFGAMRLWMGAQWTGSFDATDIVVTGKPQ